MTRVTKILLGAALAALLGAGGAGAQDAVRIGTVDIDQALNSTDEGKKAREEMARKKREADQQMQPLIDRFTTLREELEGKKYVLSDEALFTKQADLLELKNEIDSKIKELEGRLKIDQGRLEAPLRAKLVEIIAEIGREQGFTMIISRSSPGVLYLREALDITEAVIERFNRKRG